MDTFTPAKNPSINGTTVQMQPRLITVPFGDGYKQSSPDGLNCNPVTVTLVWASIDQTDGQNILDFMNGHVGVTFYYTLPGDYQRKYQWLSGSNAPLSADVMTITLQLEQRFDQVS